MTCDRKSKSIAGAAAQKVRVPREAGRYTGTCVRCQSPLVRGTCPYRHMQVSPSVVATEEKRPLWGDERWMQLLPSAPREHVEAAEAVLYGMSGGDALAAPVEFMSLRSIRERYGERGVLDLPPAAHYTDDTQMALYLTRALIDAGERDIEGVMDEVAKQFVRWSLDSTTHSRAPGATCLNAARALAAGVHWTRSGVYSRGCGSAMRVAPVGYLYQHDPIRLRAIAWATSIITHRDPVAIAAAVGMAYLVKLALDGEEVKRWPEGVREFTQGISPVFDSTISRVQECVSWKDEERALEYLGRGWVGDEAVALAVYCVMRYPDDYLSAVRRAANTEGDSDSIACMAGALSAARLGVKAIPTDWRECLEDGAWMGAAAQHLAAKKVEVMAQPRWSQSHFQEKWGKMGGQEEVLPEELFPASSGKRGNVWPPPFSVFSL